MPNPVEQVSSWIRNSPMLRLLLVGFLTLLLQIPIVMIGGLVSERQERRDTAVGEVSSKWGKDQALTGPALVVPYTHRWLQPQDKGEPIARSETRHVIVLPERLRVHGTIDTDVRSRGIFSIPVYTLGLTLEGEFGRPDLSSLDIAPADVLWDGAHLAVGISDARAIQEEIAVSWNGNRVAFSPGTHAFTDASTGIHAMVGVPADAQRLAFSFPLTLNGTHGVSLTPFGQTTVVELESDFGHPSFQGNWLPSRRTVSDSGFTAEWSIPYLGRNYPQAWVGEVSMREAIDASRFGVDLVDPVDHYRMASRSVKYAGLYILLTFATVWLIEVLSGVRVHPIQYVMLGGALCLFFLLELSLSEHLGFPVAYALASLLVIGMTGAYCWVVLQSLSRALFVAAGVVMLYVYLYILLMNEDYALLIGSVGLFAILAAIMYATRRVDWYTGGGRLQAS